MVRSLERDVGTLTLWSLAMACCVRVAKREKEGGC